MRAATPSRAFRRAYRTGEVAPVTGIYRVVHQEHRPDHDAVIIRSENLPACRTCNGDVQFIVESQASPHHARLRLRGVELADCGNCCSIVKHCLICGLGRRAAMERVLILAPVLLLRNPKSPQLRTRGDVGPTEGTDGNEQMISCPVLDDRPVAMADHDGPQHPLQTYAAFQEWVLAFALANLLLHYSRFSTQTSRCATTPSTPTASDRILRHAANPAPVRNR